MLFDDFQFKKIENSFFVSFKNTIYFIKEFFNLLDQIILHIIVLLKDKKKQLLPFKYTS